MNTQKPDGRGYWLKDGRIRWSGYEVKRADPETFQALNHIWAKDAKRVYTQNSVNKLADRDSFEVLNHIYARDKHRVYCLSGWVKEADVKTFRVLDEGRMPGPEFARGPIKEVAWNYGGFACDAHFVFYDDMLEGKPCVLRGADAAQFAVLAHGFGRDSKTVYYRKSRVKSAVSETFQILNQFYSTDGRKFFYMERAIANADPHSFEVLADCWARDGKHAFFQDGAVANADAATFGIVNQSFARDANHVFGWTGCIIDRADPELFEQIDDSLFYRDNRGVYFGGYPSGWLEGADPATFQVGPNCNEGHDREWVYQGKERKGPRQTDEPRK